MGCGYANPQLESAKQHPNLSVIKQNIGSMSLKIVQFSFKDINHHPLNPAFEYLRIRLFNQSFKSFLHHNFGHRCKIPVQPSQFSFVINTLEKQKPLEVLLFSKEELRSQKKLAVSHFDVSSLIFRHQDSKILTQTSLQQSGQTIAMKLHSVEGVQICSLFLSIQFTPQNYESLTIKVNSITLRNYSSIKRKVYVRIQVGQEIFESASAEQNKRKIPSWSDAFHTFLVPFSLKEGIIQVYQKKQQKLRNKLLGKLRLNLKIMLADESLQSFSEQITLNEEITGTIMLQTLKNVQPYDFKKFEIDLPKKIKIEKQPLQNRDETVTQINSIDTLRKTFENQPTTNISSNRSKAFSSAKFSKGSKSKNKSSNIYRKNTFVLPPIKSAQSARFTARQRDYIFWLNDDIQDQIRRRQCKKGQNRTKNIFQADKIDSSFAKISIQDNNKIDIIKTESFFLQKQKQTQKLSQQNEYQLMQLAEFEPLDHWVNKSNQVIEKDKLSERILQEKTIEDSSIKRELKAYTSLSRIQIEKMNQQKEQKVEVTQKLIPIERDLESRLLSTFTTQKTQKPSINLEPGYIEFDLSIKDESNHSQKLNSCKVDIIETQNIQKPRDNFTQIQTINQTNLKKINAIKELNKFIEVSQEYFEKDNGLSKQSLKLLKQQIQTQQIKP